MSITFVVNGLLFLRLIPEIILSVHGFVGFTVDFSPKMATVTSLLQRKNKRTGGVRCIKTDKNLTSLKNYNLWLIRNSLTNYCS